MLRIVILTASVSLLVVAFQPSPIAADEREAAAELKKILSGICQKHKVPSLTIAVASSDEIVTTQCSGVRKRGTKSSVSVKDRHPIGSCTKSMTATLAAVLVESGKIEWDTTISQVWPKATEKHLHPSLRDVTLDELLAHQAGLLSDLGNGTDWLSFFEEKTSPTLERRRMMKLILKRKPQFPRGEHHYSNLGYVVAATMLEKRGGASFEKMMRRHVFEPLKMETAEFRTMNVAKKLKAPLLWGHIADGTPIDPRVAGAENPSVYASCATVNISIADYARYAQWHLKEKPGPVLTNVKSLEHLHTARVTAPSGKYGCGWIFVDTGLGRALNHGGSNTNSFALIWIFPDRDFAAVACTNTGENSGFLACDEAIQELIKRYATAKQG